MKRLHVLRVCIVLTFYLCGYNAIYAQTRTLLKTDTEASFHLGSLFKDHMVLQREMPIPVWGKSVAGSSITVKFADSEKTTITDLNGSWRVDLEALKASFEPRTMIISSSVDSKVLQISDVVVGEVWICSGQSNMQLSVNAVPEIKSLVPSAQNIRSFAVKNMVAFEPQDACEGSWVNEQPNSAVAFSFAYFLEKAANVPIGIILTSWGSSSIEAWMPRNMTETVPHFKTLMKEFDADIETKTRINNILEGPKPWPKQDDVFLRRQSNILYNAMMHPLVPYACRGLVWYQGERNTQSMNGMLKEPWYSRNSGILMYGGTLKKWIQQYRKSWDKSDMHFLVVMLPGYGKVLKSGKEMDPESPMSHSWAWMRESQLKALELSNTSVVNTIDLGDVKNIHPKDKLPIGKRLALLAMSDVFNENDKGHGPTLKKVKLKGDKLEVHFNHAKGLKTKDGKTPTGFWLADDSKRWYLAQVEIKGEKVILNTPKLNKPLYIRYAFTGKPNVNLVNESNLPAYPFRTDNFQP